MSIAYSSRAARRITWTLFVTQSLALAAVIANSTVNPIIGAQLSGQDALAGLPSTLMLVGAASAAYPAGRLMERAGRRGGLALGFFFGLVGMLIAGAAVVGHSFAGFLAGMLLIGSARGAFDQSRYAAADAQLPERRAKAISTVVFAGTIGAIGGPALVAPLGAAAERMGVDPLSGTMFSGAALFLLAGALILLFLRPDPRDIGRAIAAAFPQTVPSSGPARTLREILRLPAARLALAALVFGQMVMALVMSMVSLHMYNHQHALSDVSWVIMAHTLGMYGLSVVTGPMVDRIGRRPAIALGAGLLISGSLLAPSSLMTNWIALAEFLVGLGWNVCYISGSSLLSDILAPSERSQIQGATDLIVNVASATSSLGSGFILGMMGFGSICVLGALLATPPLLLLGWQGIQRTRLAAGQA